MAIFTLINVALVVLGLVVWNLTKKVFNIVYNYAIGPAVNKVDFGTIGKWALVTGCTDGIGKEYAKQLASKGCSIILVSRSMDKLKATAAEIENDYKVETKIIQADFTSGEEIYPRIESEISGLEIGTLVNNVGISYAHPEYFLDLPECDTLCSNLIRANVVSVTRMTRMVMPEMVKRQKGVVINIGSASSIIPSPLLSVYAATKAYVDKFTEGIEMEYRKHGIVVQCIMPGFVCSNMSGIKRSTLFAPTAKNFVKSALALVGTMTRTTGYFPHAIFVEFINTLYESFTRFATWMIMRSMENTRNKVLKKQKKQ